MTPEEEQRRLSELEKELKRAEEATERSIRAWEETRAKIKEQRIHKPGNEKCTCNECVEERKRKFGIKD